jgi:hypothetical protein
MTPSYRRMRKHARQVRRGGMQPMMVVNTGDSFPETVGVLLLRSLWRYRSELAPLGTVAVIAGIAAWLHATRPHWWGITLTIAVVAAVALVVGGAVIGLWVPAGATIRGHGDPLGRRVDRRSNRAQPVQAATARSPYRRRLDSLDPLVGESAPSCQGPRGAHSRSVA